MRRGIIYCKHCGEAIGTKEEVGRKRVCPKCKHNQRKDWNLSGQKRYRANHPDKNGYKELNKKYKEAIKEIEHLKDLIKDLKKEIISYKIDELLEAYKRLEN